MTYHKLSEVILFLIIDRLCQRLKWHSGESGIFRYRFFGDAQTFTSRIGVAALIGCFDDISRNPGYALRRRGFLLIAFVD